MPRGIFRLASLHLEVVVGDIVVVGLHLAEGLLVVLHEVVDVKVFSFLDLVNVHLMSVEADDVAGRQTMKRGHTNQFKATPDNSSYFTAKPDDGHSFLWDSRTSNKRLLTSYLFA